MKPTPPRGARLLIRLTVHGDMRHWILGDLEEAWHGWVARGMDRAAARRRYWRQAVASVANVWMDGIRRVARQPGGDGMVGWIKGLGLAVRTLMRRPGYTASVVATLGLGMGATTAVYSVVDGVLLRPLDLPRAEKLVILWTRNDGEDDNSSGPNLMDLREDVGAFEELYAFSGDRSVVEDPQGRRRMLPTLRVTSPALRVLALTPVVGRDFDPSDVGEGAAPVVMLSHAFWTSAYGADPTVVGQPLLVGGRATEIIGVLPAGARIPMGEDAELVLPFARAIGTEGRDMVWLGGIARVAGGATPAAAAAEAEAVWEGLRQRYPDDIQDSDISVVPLQSYLVRDVARALYILLASTGFLLLMACVNAGGLLAVRGRARLQELAVRQALGAGRGRMVGELAREGVVLLAVAIGAGFVVAHGALALILRLAPADLPRVASVGIDLRVLAVTSAVALMAGLVTVLLPARRIVSAIPARGLGTRGSVSGRGESRGRALLIASQVAAAVVLLAGATLTIRSMATLLSVDPGYRIEDVVTAGIELPEAEFGDREARAQAFRDIEEYAGSLPGVVSAGVSLLQPMQEGRINFELALDGNAAPEPAATPVADLQIASGGYFRSLDITVVQGRLFGPQDGPGDDRVALVNRSLSDELWPGGSAVGHTIGFLSGDSREPGTWWTVVGIVEDTRFQSLDDLPRGTMYVPVSQLPQYSASLVVHVRGDAGGVADALRDGVPDVVPGLAEPEISTLSAERAETLAQSRFRTVLLSVFALLALVLAAVGIYGTMAYVVGRRRREIGLRVALGAEPSSVAGGILVQGLIPVALGVAIGLVVSLGAGRVVASLLYEITPTDPLALGGATAILALVALAACLGPAWRASRIDPVESLRGDA